MARQTRIEYPGAFYHAFARGMEKKEIFKDDQDCHVFFNICSEIALPLGLVLHSYCLMVNHYHFFIETPLGNLSQIMKAINERYTQYFNKKYDRVGYLFQGRYKAILVDSQSYAKELSRYIHRNPLEANLVSDLKDWRWSSYRSFLYGANPKENFLCTEWVLDQFAPKREDALRLMVEFTNLEQDDSSEFVKNISSKPILGSERFVESLLQRGRVDGIQAGRILDGKEDVSVIVDSVDLLELPKEVKRKILVYMFKNLTNYSYKEIGNICEIKNSNTVSKVYHRFKKDLEKEGTLKKIVNDLLLTMSYVQDRPLYV